MKCIFMLMDVNCGLIIFLRDRMEPTNAILAPIENANKLTENADNI